MYVYIYIYIHAGTRLPKCSHAPGVLAPLAYPVPPPHGTNYWKVLWGVDSIPVITGMLDVPKYFPIVGPMGGGRDTPGARGACEHRGV